MIVVVDASAAVKLVLDEDGSDVVRRIWDEPVRWVAPAIVLAEVAAGIGAAHRCGRLSAAAAHRARGSWMSVSEEIDLLDVDTPLAALAGELAATRPLPGMDAVYLATATRLSGAGPVGLLSFDHRQRAGLLPDDAVGLLPAALS